MSIQPRQKIAPSGNLPPWVSIITALSIASGGLFLLLGMAFMAVGIWSYWDTNQFTQTARSAQGTVIELVGSASQDQDGHHSSSSALCPVIEFTDHRGDSTTFQINACSYPPRYRRGERVEVLYALNNPHHAKLNDKSLYLITYIFAGIGVLSTVIGFSLLIAIFFVRKWLVRKANNRARS